MPDNLIEKRKKELLEKRVEEWITWLDHLHDDAGLTTKDIFFHGIDVLINCTAIVLLKCTDETSLHSDFKKEILKSIDGAIELNKEKYNDSYLH